MTAAEAIAMLPDARPDLDRDVVHVYTRSMIGADWDRQDVLDLIEKAPHLELAGSMATQMGHGLAVWGGDDIWLVETRGTDA